MFAGSDMRHRIGYMKKKSIILCSLVVICAIGLVASIYIDWPVDFNKSDGDIAKAAKFSREEVSKDLSNMEVR